MKVNSISNIRFSGLKLENLKKTVKVCSLTGLLAASPFAAKAQSYIYTGERIIGRDSVELLNGKKAVALFIDRNGDTNTFERIAYSTFTQTPSKHKDLKGKEGFIKDWVTQYVDTLVRVFTRVEGESKETPKYYIAGPRLRKKILEDKESGKILRYWVDNSKNRKIGALEEVPHHRMEIPEEQYNNLLEVLPQSRVKEEHVVIPANYEEILYGL